MYKYFLLLLLFIVGCEMPKTEIKEQPKECVVISNITKKELINQRTMKYWDDYTWRETITWDLEVQDKSGNKFLYNCGRNYTVHYNKIKLGHDYYFTTSQGFLISVEETEKK